MTYLSIAHPKNKLKASAHTIGKGLLLSLSLPCAIVWAQGTDATPAGAQASDGGNIGVGVASTPTYQGSDQIRTRGMLVGEYHWANGMFVGGDNGLIGVQSRASPTFQYGFALGIDGGRKESDSSYLTGMGDVAAKGTINAFAKAAVTDQFAVGYLLQIGSGSTGKGTLLNLGASYSVPLGTSAQLGFNVGATLANAEYMQDYFGVNAKQASATTYRQYFLSNGLRDVSAGVGLNYQINRHWSVVSGVSFTKLSSMAKDSPLVRRDTTQSAFFALAYTF